MTESKGQYTIQNDERKFVHIPTETINSLPCKCDHCTWTGLIGEAPLNREGKARCPKCQGQLALNRLVDQIVDKVQDIFDPDGIGSLD